jgi:hypothetical protein
MEEYLYIACAFVAVLVVVVLMYTGSVYVMREKSFESALVEQSNIRRELLEQTSNKHDRKVRRQQVRGKQLEKSQTESTNEVVVAPETPVNQSPASANHSPASKKRVELALEPKIIVIEEDVDVGTQDRKSSCSPSKPAKSILLNKDEKGQVSASIVAPDLFHRQISVDELDLKTEKQKSVTGSQIETTITPVTENRLKANKKKKSKGEVLQDSTERIQFPPVEEEVSDKISSTTVCGMLFSFSMRLTRS